MREALQQLARGRWREVFTDRVGIQMTECRGMVRDADQVLVARQENIWFPGDLKRCIPPQ